MQLYVKYRRVSMAEQGKSGLGLDAQDRDMEIYLKTYSDKPYQVIGEFTDIQSGKMDTAARPQFEKALELCRKNKAVLLVSKLDRLSRRVSIIAALMEDKTVKFQVAMFPHADPFQLHIYAALAEQERKFIGLRTKQALAEAKKRGVKLGGKRPGHEKANAAKVAIADEFAQRVGKLITDSRKQKRSLAFIADQLNSLDIRTASGFLWTPTQVSRVLQRMENLK